MGDCCRDCVFLVKLGDNLGRLAQLVERHIDVVNVTGSTPVSPTKKIKHPIKGVLFFWAISQPTSWLTSGGERRSDVFVTTKTSEAVSRQSFATAKL